MNKRYLTCSFVILLCLPLHANQDEKSYEQLFKGSFPIIKKLALVGFGLFLGKFIYNKFTKPKITKQQKNYSPTREEITTALKKVGRTKERQKSAERRARPSSTMSPTKMGFNINKTKRRSSSSYSISPQKLYSRSPLKEVDGNASYLLAATLKKKGEFEEALFHMELASRAGNKQAKTEYPEMAFQCAVQAKKDNNHIEAHDYMLKAAQAGHKKAQKKCAKISFELANITKEKDKINATLAHLQTAQDYGHPQAEQERNEYIDRIVDGLPDCMPLR